MNETEQVENVMGLIDNNKDNDWLTDCEATMSCCMPKTMEATINQPNPVTAITVDSNGIENDGNNDDDNWSIMITERFGPTRK